MSEKLAASRAGIGECTWCGAVWRGDEMGGVPEGDLCPPCWWRWREGTRPVCTGCGMSCKALATASCCCGKALTFAEGK